MKGLGPQFRRLDYPLYAALMRANVSGSVFRVLLVVIDFTIGYRKPEAGISLSTFKEKTGLTRQGVIKALHQAEVNQFINVDREKVNPRAPAQYRLRPVSEWITSKQPLTSLLVNSRSLYQSTTVDHIGKQVTPATPVERNYKESLKKEHPDSLAIDNPETPSESFGDISLRSQGASPPAPPFLGNDYEEYMGIKVEDVHITAHYCNIALQD